MRALRMALVGALVIVLSAPAQAAEWQPPQDIPSGSTRLDLDVAVGSGGDVLAVWSSDGGALRWSYRPAGGRFGEVTGLAEGVGIYPQVEVDAQGRFTVLWIGGDHAVRSAVLEQGRFGPPAVVAPPPDSGTRGYPSLDVAPSGAAAAAWHLTQKAGLTETTTRIEAALRPPGAGWEQHAVISDGDVADLRTLETGVDSAGGGVVFWQRWEREEQQNDPLGWYDERRYEVAAGQPGVGFSEPAVVGGERTHLAYPHLAVAPTGDTLITWLEPGTSEAITAVSGTTAAPVGPEHEVVRWSDQDAREPIPRFDASGRAYVFFLYGRSAADVHLAERATSSAVWETPRQVTTGGSGPFAYAVSPRGDVFVVVSPSEQGRFAYVRPADAADFSGPREIDTAHGWGELEAGAGGQAVAAYNRYEGTRAVLYDDTSAAPPLATKNDERPPRCQLGSLAPSPIAFALTCDEQVQVTATATLTGSDATRTARLARARRRVPASHRARLQLKPTRRGRATLRRAMRDDGRARVRIVAVARDAAGNATTKRRSVVVSR